MKKINLSKLFFLKYALAILTTAVVTLPALAQEPLSPLAIQKWSIQGGKLVDPKGNPFIFRGVTINHTLAPEKTVQAIKDIAAAGANAAQIEISTAYETYPRPVAAQLPAIIAACKDNKLVCVLEPNNAAGYPYTSAITGNYLASLWTWNDIYPSLVGNQGHIIIGFGNQHFAVSEAPGEYQYRMKAYLDVLVDELPAGYLIMIDGNNWAEDTTKSMLDLARTLKDPTQKLANRIIYSVDMFAAYQDPIKIQDYIASFSQLGAPLVVGGFGPVPYIHPLRGNPVQINPPQLPAASVMQYAEQYGAGYFGWSWSGNENSALDLVSNWDANLVTPWGDLLFNDTNGIKATAKLATHFSSSSSSVSSTSSRSSSSAINTPPIAVLTTPFGLARCDYLLFRASAEESTDADGDTLTYAWQVTYDSSSFTSTGIRISFAVTASATYTVKLTVSDGKGGSSTTSKTFAPLICEMPSSSFSFSSSSVTPSSSSSVASSLMRRSSIPSSTPRSSSSTAAKASCSYVIGSQWGNGFTAAIRVKNTSAQTLNGWSVNWQYSDGSKVTNLWNANFSGSNPYNAKNLGWNATIQPGQTVEFGFQGSKPSGAAAVPIVTGAVCQ
jgi:mannan endo-1,4-beta-mannosidase